MDRFFERLMTEDDPAEFAAMAENLPEPPPLDVRRDHGLDDRAPPSRLRRRRAERRGRDAVAEATVEATADDAAEADRRDRRRADRPRPRRPRRADDRSASADDGVEYAVQDDPAAVEAAMAAIEAAYQAGRDRRRRQPAAEATSRTPEPMPTADDDPRLAALGSGRISARPRPRPPRPPPTRTDDEIPTIDDDALAARLAGLVPPAGSAAPTPRAAAPKAAATSQVVVTGLVSVASIASFKRHLGRVAGVQSVGVSSGPDGEFVFTVGARRRRVPGRRHPDAAGLRGPRHRHRRRRRERQRPRSRVRGLGPAAAGPHRAPMARQTVAVALPTRGARAGRARARRPPATTSSRVASPEELDDAARVAARLRPGHPRRRERLRPVARVLLAAPRERPGHPGADGRLAAQPRAARRGPATKATINDEYFTRPYSRRLAPLAGRGDAHPVADRRRRQGPDHRVGPGPRLRRAWTKRATIVAVFNPKGGVGKTTISINLATTLQVRRGQRVLLVDADTVTGHIANSLGLDQVQTVDDAWEDDRAEGNDRGRSPSSRPTIRTGSRSPS